MKKKTVVAVSGYYDPPHEGHIEHLVAAKSLGDYLVVILNNNEQAALKKGKAFYDMKTKVSILGHLEMVDEVFISIDKGRTIEKSLEAVNPDIFAKGGDVVELPEPERDVCVNCNIDVVFNVGGGKINSSSWIINDRKS